MSHGFRVASARNSLSMYHNYNNGNSFTETRRYLEYNLPRLYSFISHFFNLYLFSRIRRSALSGSGPRLINSR